MSKTKKKRMSKREREDIENNTKMRSIRIYVPDDEECEGFVEFKKRFILEKPNSRWASLKTDWEILFYKHHYKIGNSKIDSCHYHFL